MTTTMTDEKLRNHSIRPTAIRKTILDLFITSGYALSHADIEKLLGNQCDRVTIYRTLERFEQKGLIHKVPDNSNINKYAVCSEKSCSSQQHHDEHLHFTCESCGNIFCLNIMNMPALELPSGYLLNRISLEAEGICKGCNEIN